MPGFWIPLLWGLAGHLPKRGCQGSCTERSPCIKFLFGVAAVTPSPPPQILMPAIVSLHLLFPPHLWLHSLLLLHLFSSSVPISSRSCKFYLQCEHMLWFARVTVYPLSSSTIMNRASLHTQNCPSLDNYTVIPI